MKIIIFRNFHFRTSYSPTIIFISKVCFMLFLHARTHTLLDVFQCVVMHINYVVDFNLFIDLFTAIILAQMRLAAIFLS
jgi:hypothetical protein